MDSINQNLEKVPNTKKKWFDAKSKLYIKTEQTFYHKNKLKRQGTKDSRRGLIKFLENTENPNQSVIALSPFISQLVENANKILTSIWEDCDFDLAQTKEELEILNTEYHKLKEIEIPNLINRVEEIEKKETENKLDADNYMNEAVINNRIERRKNLKTHDYKNTITELNNKLDEIVKLGKQKQTELENRELIAHGNEDKVIHTLKEDVNIYIQGAWKYMNTVRYEVEPPPITEEPKKRHYRLFPRYDF